MAMSSPSSSRAYNSPRHQRAPASSSRSSRHSRRSNYDLNNFIPDQRPNNYGSFGNFTIDIFIPSNEYYRLPRTRRPRPPTMSAQGDRVYGGADDNGGPSESSHFRNDQEGLKPLWYLSLQCRWSTTDTNNNARQYEFLLEDIFQVFPQVALLGKRHFMDHDTFTVDQYLSRSVLTESPRKLLIDAYHFVFEHLLSPSPMYARLRDRHAGHPDAVQRICKDFLALSTLFSALRGLGCGFYLMDDFLEALIKLWTEAKDNMHQDQQVSMFIANLEVFADVLKTEFRGPGGRNLDGFVAIWESLDRETQLVIEATVYGEARDYDTDERWDLWTALERLMERSPIHPRQADLPERGGRPGPGGWPARGGTPDIERRPLWGGRALGTEGGGEQSGSPARQHRRSRTLGKGQSEEHQDSEGMSGVPGRRSPNRVYETDRYPEPNVRYEYERVHQGGGPSRWHEHLWERRWERRG